jgi:hypothetical protein
MDCDVLQGYLFSRPVAAEQLEKDFNPVEIKNLLNRYNFSKSKSEQVVGDND